MSELTVIHNALHEHGTPLSYQPVPVRANRMVLLKRRWRAVADDGREFGFDLQEPLRHGTHIFIDGEKHYVLEQTSEIVLETLFSTPEQAVRLAWNIGNLHFGIQILPGAIRVTEDPAILQLFDREGITYQRVNCVYQPLSTGTAHSHEGHASHAHA